MEQNLKEADFRQDILNEKKIQFRIYFYLFIIYKTAKNLSQQNIEYCKNNKFEYQAIM